MTLPQWVTLVAARTPTLPPATGTNLFLVSDGGEGLVIDAGYSDPEALRPLTDAVRERNLHITGILLTHHHPDHAAGAGYLAELWDCPVHIHPADAEAVRQYVPEPRLRPDLVEGTTRQVGEVRLVALETPGHTPGHLCFWEPTAKVLFTGDAVLGAGTTWIGPPDGHLRTYLNTLRKLLTYPADIAGPAHGPLVQDPAGQIRYYLSHRQEREEQIMSLIDKHPRRIADLVSAIYEGQIPPAARWVAERTLLGHLVKLEEEGRVTRAVDTGTPVPLHQVTWTDEELRRWTDQTVFSAVP
ncbi:MAG: MBL fold metallo-hydrolase [Kyrpidia tusciae]|nr:MBL fold metallo-hydrolase [Kyrpidia tusciae]MBE3552299.1 MBL fold metallo-hydrolase [Kyrpidia tusciae]